MSIRRSRKQFTFTFDALARGETENAKRRVD
jgi:hypothetical protein